MSVEQYWIGKDIDIEDVWRDFESGSSRYQDKFKKMETHLIDFVFDYPDKSLPLFNHEAIYKTIKSYYHDVKKIYFSTEEYNEFGPIFLYEIGRGSQILSFLTELTPMLVLLKDILGVYNIKDAIELLAAGVLLKQAFFPADKTRPLGEFLKKQGLKQIIYSKKPFDRDANASRKDSFKIDLTI